MCINKSSLNMLILFIWNPKIKTKLNTHELNWHSSSLILNPLMKIILNEITYISVKKVKLISNQRRYTSMARFMPVNRWNRTLVSQSIHGPQLYYQTGMVIQLDKWVYRMWTVSRNNVVVQPRGGVFFIWKIIII